MTNHYPGVPIQLIRLEGLNSQGMDRNSGRRRAHGGNPHDDQRPGEFPRFLAYSLDDGTPIHLPLRACFYEDLENTPRPPPRRLERQEFSNAMPFKRAIQQLFNQLEIAGRFYNNFQVEFDSETEAIKKYSASEIVEELWVSKVKAGLQKSPPHNPPSSTNDSTSQTQAQNFETVGNKLLRALQVVPGARIGETRISSSTNGSRLDAVVRIQKKVDLASEQFSELTQKALDSRSHCIALLREIELLKTMINPDDEKNKEIFLKGEGDDDLDSE